jgi:uncharacterized caspase-like protein
MPRILSALLAVWASIVVIAALPDHASAQRRVAFVVGTDKYSNLGRDRQLQRAANDARAVGKALKALGFEIFAGENLTRAGFNAQFQSFLDKLVPGDTAAFYYAGHGVEIEGLNFLLPSDIPDVKFGRQEQIKRESLSVAELLLDLRGRNPEITLVILDACRDNPLIPEELRSAATRGGLAPLKGEPPKGTFIMYSAGAGESALDRLPGNDPDAVNSIFTRRLVPLLGTKGLALHEMARQVRSDVIELAATVPHEQRPAYYDGVVGKYCLAGCDTPRPLVDQQIELAFWLSVKDTTDPAVFSTYLEKYPNGEFSTIARALIGHYEQQAKVENAQRDEDQRREEERRKALEVTRLEEELRLREAAIVGERRRAQESSNREAAKRAEEVQRAEAAARAEAIQKATKEQVAAQEAARIAEQKKLAAAKASEEATKAAEATIAAKRDAVGATDPVKVAALPKIEKPGLVVEFDGEWRTAIATANEHCIRKEHTRTLKIRGQTVGGSDLIKGNVDKDGRIAFVTPNKRGDKNVAHTGKLNGSGGYGTYSVIGGTCRGTFVLRRSTK